MKCAKRMALISTLTLLFPLLMWARNKNQRSVDIPDSVQVGTAQLKPGNYRLEWQDAGSAVYVKFEQNGKIVATASGTLKMNDSQVTQDDVVIQTTGADKKVLKEIDFSHQKEALVFG
jgi:hypothetical protein